MIGIFITISPISAYNNGLGAKPNMGWNPWNSFGCKISQEMVKSAALKIIETGLADKGYRIVNLDDCWAVSRIGGIIQPDSNNFPSGLKALGDWLHSKNLKFGIYSSSGTSTCAGRPGSVNFQVNDANSYASWGVDFLKYDDCGSSGGYTYLERYKRMSDALNKTGRPIFYSITSGRGNLVRLIGSSNIKKISNSFTTFQNGDFYDNWKSFLSHLDQQVGQHNIGSPYGWANPDMLQVGNPGMNSVEHQSHFALWALLKAPLVIGCDITKISNATLAILNNEQVIAVNQDDLGEPGQLVFRTSDYYIWAGRLKDGWAVVMLNRAEAPRNITFKTEMINLRRAKGQIRDLLERKVVGPMGQSYTREVVSHGVHMFKLSKIFGSAS